MKPQEFWECTYRELSEYVKANVQQREEDYKKEIVLMDAYGNKLLTALATKRPKNISLVSNVFRELFKDELEQNKHQSIEEQIRNLRSRK